MGREGDQEEGKVREDVA